MMIRVQMCAARARVRFSSVLQVRIGGGGGGAAHGVNPAGARRRAGTPLSVWAHAYAHRTARGPPPRGPARWPAASTQLLS